MVRSETTSLNQNDEVEDGPLLLTTDSASVKDVGDTSALEYDTGSATSSDCGSVVYDLDSTIASIRRSNPLGSVGRASHCSSKTPMSSTCRSIQSNDFQELNNSEVRDTTIFSYEQELQEQRDRETRDGPILSLECITDSLDGLFCPGLIESSCLSQSNEDEDTLNHNFFNCDDLFDILPSSQMHQIYSVPTFTMISPDVDELQKNIEHEIDQFLGHTKDATRLCKSQMHAFFKLFAHKDGSSLRGEQDGNNSPEKVVLRNRNMVIGAKEKRMQTLQDNMGGTLLSSFANNFQTNREKSYPMAKAKSMGHDGTKFKDKRKYTSKLSRSDSKEGLWFSKQKHETEVEETELYYDSEPDDNKCGDITSKRDIQKIGMVKNQQNEQTFAEMKGGSNFPRHSEEVSESNQKGCKEKKTRNPPRLSRKYLIKNDDIVLQFIQELTAGFIKLTWHPTKQQPIPSPTYVNAWCELGNNLDNSVVYPKFMWRTTYESEMRHTTRISGSNPSVHGLDLLNIVRVLKPAVIDRSTFPFANRKKSFLIISSSGETFLFEAANDKERDHIVNGIKLTISRLASKIMIGDETVFDEFFSPIGMIEGSATSRQEDIVYDLPSEPKEESQIFKKLTTADSTSEKYKKREQGRTSVLK